MRTLLTVTIVLGIASAETRAQGLVHAFHGDTAGDRLGIGVAGPGDVNGDGVPDVLVASPGSPTRHVRAYDGVTGGHLWSVKGVSPGDGFGEVLDAVGDLDGDGAGEFAVGAPAGSYVRLFDGATQALLHQWNVATSRVSGVGDCDGDGTDDVAIGGGGHLRIYSGASPFGLLHDIPGSTMFFGTAIDAAGDCDGDGRADVIVGDGYQFENGERGTVWVYSGQTGTLLWQWDGLDDWHWFGAAVAGVGDVDGDGHDDVCAVAAIEHLLSYDRPYVRVYSGATGALLLHVETSESSGISFPSACGVGDIDGDGGGDFLVGGWGLSAGTFLDLFSGASGTLLYTATPGKVSWQSLELVGDLHRDGFPEVVYGAHYESPNGHQSGTAQVLQVLSNEGTPYCFGDGSGTPCPCGNLGGSGEGCASSLGSGAALVAGGTASVSADDLTFAASRLLAGQAALCFVARNPLNGGDGLLFGDGLRCAGGGLIRLGVDIPGGAGDAAWGPGLSVKGGWAAGEARLFQVWCRDPIGSPCASDFNLTNGVSVVFRP